MRKTSTILLSFAMLCPLWNSAQADTAGNFRAAGPELRGGTDFPLAHICILDENSGVGRSKVTTLPSISRLLTQVFPERYTLVLSVERCGDALDNNCDGRVNEGCSPSGPDDNVQPPGTPARQGVWDAATQCGVCMYDRCSDHASACEDDAYCPDAIACAKENHCMDDFAGAMGCVCGEDLSFLECAHIQNGDFQGACVDELDPVHPSQRKDLQGILKNESGQASRNALTCMMQQCPAACSDYFRES